MTYSVYSVSTRKTILEMNSEEIEKYISVKFNKFCNRDLNVLMEIANTPKSDIATCLRCWKELNGDKDFNFNIL